MIDIELVYSPTGECIHRIKLRVKIGTTLEQAVEQSGWSGKILPEHWCQHAVGIWGEQKSLSAKLNQGDRIEIYVPVLIDPKQARRIRAKKND